MGSEVRTCTENDRHGVLFVLSSALKRYFGRDLTIQSNASRGHGGIRRGVC